MSSESDSKYDEGDSGSSSEMGRTVDQIAEGGLLRLMLSKPIQKAIGRLVSGVTDVPIAYFERWVQSIRTETDARKLVTDAVALEAARVAAANQSLVGRGVDLWTAQLTQRQLARENIGLRTLAILAENENVRASSGEPSEDFMRLFEEMAERASSEELADVMARIFAGEIRRPGAVSRKTLQVASILDMEIVSALYAIRPFILDNYWIHLASSQGLPRYEDVSLLATVSILSEPRESGLRLNGDDRSVIRMGSRGIVLTVKSPIFPWIISVSSLTPTGLELLSVLPSMSYFEVEKVARGFIERSFITKVEVGTTVERDGSLFCDALYDIS